MRCPLILSLVMLPVMLLVASPSSFAEQPAERIRQIVLHEEDSPRALAHLVQLSRDLDDATSAQLFLDLAEDYLAEGNYNQAADFMQQLVNQHPKQPATQVGILRLVQLYSSSEVNHTQGADAEGPQHSNTQMSNHSGFCKYALHLANNALQKNGLLDKDPALTFQRAVAARGAGNTGVAKSLLTRLKHDRAAVAWHPHTRAEQWLADNRQGESPLPVLACRRTAAPPHLDGDLSDPLWQSDLPGQLTPIQWAYDDEFLYFAARYPRQAGVEYQPDDRPRTHDADLAQHDRVRLRLDLDRDYATCFEFTIDHRGWTAERCWLHTGWNPHSFVAAAVNDTHWTVESAIPLASLTASPLQRAGDAWAISMERVLPRGAALPPPAEAGSPEASGAFQLLLFE